MSIAKFLETWDGKAPLPDEEPGERLRFAPGVMDGMFRGSEGEPDVGARVARAVVRAAERGDDLSRQALYALALNAKVQGFADEMFRVIAESDPEAGRVAEVGRWLARTATDREPAKLGLLLIGSGGDRSDLPLLELFARNDEFTKYAAVSAGAILDDPVSQWMRMAGQVHGWGKIDLVERITARIGEQGFDRPDVRDWLLRHGCSNYVMDEYLGHVCATAGRLHEAIRAESVDDQLLDGMATIVLALTSESGAAADIRDYPHAEEVVLELLRHFAARPAFERRWMAARLLLWGHQTEVGSDEFRQEVRQRSRAIVEQVTEDELRVRFRGEWKDRFQAWQLSEAAGIDLWEDAFQQLQAKQDDGYLYQCVLGTADAMRLRRVVAFAEEHLPLDEIAVGPENNHGIGTGYGPHHCLDFLVQRMRKGDVFSPRLVLAALQSPVTRNRNMAIAAIEAQLPRPVPNALVEAVRAGVSIEPNADTQKRMAALATKFASRP